MFHGPSMTYLIIALLTGMGEGHGVCTSSPRTGPAASLFVAGVVAVAVKP